MRIRGMQLGTKVQDASFIEDSLVSFRQASSRSDSAASSPAAAGGAETVWLSTARPGDSQAGLC